MQTNKQTNNETISKAKFFATFRPINRSLPDHKTDCQNRRDYKTGLVRISPFSKHGKNNLGDRPSFILNFRKFFALFEWLSMLDPVLRQKKQCGMSFFQPHWKLATCSPLSIIQSKTGMGQSGNMGKVWEENVESWGKHFTQTNTSQSAGEYDTSEY